MPITGFQDIPIGVRVTRSIIQAIPTGVWTPIVFDTQRWDDPNDDQWAVVPNPTRLTCRCDGLYVISSNLMWRGNAAGVNRGLAIYLNGATYIGFINRSSFVVVEGTAQTVTTTYKLTIGNFVEMMAFQDTGGNLDVLSIGNLTPEFSMVRSV